MFGFRRMICAFSCTLALALSGCTDRGDDASAENDWRRFAATAYSIEGETASGKLTREGRTIAADPRVLPIGTRVEVAGAGPYSGTYVVHDTGPKVRGRTIDIFIADAKEAASFGRKQVRVRVIALPETAESGD